MREAFSKVNANGKGWQENVVNNEVVFDFALTPACTIRVYSSIRNDSGVNRGVGQDAVRVAAFNPLTQKGLVKSSYVQRIASWKDNLRKRIREVGDTAKERFSW
jgi:hypothetical protein